MHCQALFLFDMKMYQTLRNGGFFMTFGERIRELRTQKGLTQPQLADSIGVSVRTIKSYEDGI